MALKSVIELDVNDSQFQAFQQLFHKYSQELEKSVGFWSRANAEQKKFSTNFVQYQVGALEEFNKLLNSNTSALTSQLAPSSTFSKGLLFAFGAFKGIAGFAFDTTKEIAKWGAMLAAASFTGFVALGEHVSGMRRTAKGLGSSIGSYRSFGLNFSRVTDPDSFLNSVNEMETDITKQRGAYALGVNLTGDSVKDAVKMLRAEWQLAQRLPLKMLGPTFDAYGLDSDAAFLHRLKDMGAAERSQIEAAFSKDSKTLGVSGDVAKKWTDFSTKIERTGKTFETTLINRLAPLTKSVSNVAESFVGLANTLLNDNKIVDAAITHLGSSLEDLAQKIDSTKTRNTIDKLLGDKKEKADWWNLVGNAKAFLAPTPADIKKYPGLSQSYMARLDQHFGLPAGLIETVKALERSGANAVSPKGAMGIMQLMPGTAKQYGATDPFDPVQNMNAGGKYLAHLEDKYKRDLAKVLAAYNWGEGNVDTSLAGPFTYKGQRRPQGWLPQETQQYVMNGEPLMQAYGTRVEVVINGLPPGYSATATVNGLAH
jgi:hypothetical protein